MTCKYNTQINYQLYTWIFSSCWKGFEFVLIQLYWPTDYSIFPAFQNVKFYSQWHSLKEICKSIMSITMINSCKEPIYWIISGCSQPVHFLLGPPQLFYTRRTINVTFQCVTCTLSKTWKLEIECEIYFVDYNMPCTIFSNLCWFEQSVRKMETGVIKQHWFGKIYCTNLSKFYLCFFVFTSN